MNAQFPESLEFLFEPWRFKVAYGGRGSGKSWSIARALLIQGAQQPERVLCTREVQKSIKDSVHRLLSDQIEALGLSSFYDILDTEIRGKNGTLFMFAGLSTQTAESIKSYEGVTKCWCEEAQSISKKSWDTLIPTIRKEGSEIWVSFNPELDTDETYTRFVVNPPPNACVRRVNYSENPWFPKVLDEERLHCQATNPEDYGQIWEGKCRAALAGAIYASEVVTATSNGQIGNVPYDPRLKVHTIWDLGWNDAMTIIFVQKIRSEVRVIDYIENSHKTLDWYAAELVKKNYNWGKDYLPHDGDHEDYKTGKSAKQILKAFGRKVEITPQIGIEPGIKAARMLFASLYIDKIKCARLIECLKRYRRAINKTTGEPGMPLHDEYSHGCLPAGEMVELRRGIVPIQQVLVGDEVKLPDNQYGEVINSGVSGYAMELVSIECQNGMKLTVTPNHRMLTDKGIVFAKDLDHNHLILIDGGELWKKMWSNSRGEYTALRETITTVMTSGKLPQERFIEMCGSQFMEKSLKVITYIISTITSAITQLKTWNCSQSLSITDIMALRAIGREASGTLQKYCQQQGFYQTSLEDCQRAEQEMQRDGKPTQSFMHGLVAKARLKPWIRLKSQQKNGTHPKKVESGILSTVREHGKIVLLRVRNALYAARSTRRFTQIVQSSATQIVKLRRFDVEKQPVFNLTIERHHCYFAGGMLVSNSDAFRYLGVTAELLTNDEEWQRPDVQVFIPHDRGMGLG